MTASNKRRLLTVLFLLYAAFMVYLLFEPARNGYDLREDYWSLVEQNINLVPFRTINSYVWVLVSGVTEYAGTAVVNLFGNILTFLPLGYFLPALSREFRLFLRTFFFSAMLICCIEIIQLFLLVGCCDIDDLILNLAGVSTGYLIYRLFSVMD